MIFWQFYPQQNRLENECNSLCVCVCAREIAWVCASSCVLIFEETKQTDYLKCIHIYTSKETTGRPIPHRRQRKFSNRKHNFSQDSAQSVVDLFSGYQNKLNYRLVNRVWDTSMSFSEQHDFPTNADQIKNFTQ